jgi:T-complex protein 1 subunit delta
MVFLTFVDGSCSCFDLDVARHAQGEKTAGINVRKGAITNILEENVVQPLLVSTSAITLASETVRSILKIDDIVNVMRG